MCGVIGFFAADENGRVSADDLRAATHALEHRGPDGQKTWVASHGRIGLGHSRLSIIDLAGGDQPLTNETGDIHLVANGELYDYERIRQELMARGHVLRTKSDSEIILHLYEDYGPDCLRFLRGEFAFILWDERNQLLFAARDRFGIKPLYYTRRNGILMFASEIKALLSAGVPAEWDKESIFQMYFSPLPANRSLFKDIFQLPPAHYMIATPNQTREIPYWDFDYPTRAELQSRKFVLEDEIKNVRSALDESIRLRLRADVPVGVYLSGGLDSSAILGMAARHAPKALTAFTLTFDQADYDEAAYAKETAKFVGAEWVPIEISEKDLADNYLAALKHSEVIPANTHGVAKFMLSRAVRKAGYKVVLTGEGSDEIFAGYPHFRKDLWLSSGDGPEAAKARLRELRENNKVSLGFLLAAEDHPQIPFTERTLGFTPSFLEAHWSGGMRMRNLFSDDFLRRFEHTDSMATYLSGIDIDRQMRGRDPVNQSLYLWSKTSLPNYLLNLLGDRMEMAHCVEGRVPFLDHHFVNLITRLPVDFKINGITEKYILKEATKPYITETLYKRQKHPFLAPPASTRENTPLSHLMQDTLRSRRMLDFPFFNHRKVIDLLDDLPGMKQEERASIDPMLMQIMGTSLLQQCFQIR